MSTSLRRVAQSMCNSARTRARKAGVPFTIVTDDVTFPHACPVLGIELQYGGARLCDASPTLDRIVPLVGYVPGNVIVVSARANRIKNDATPDELRCVADFYMALMRDEWMRGD